MADILSSPDRHLRRLVYELTVASGTVPSAGDLARSSGTRVDDVRESLRRLADLHALVLDDASSEILMAHPFSAVQTTHVVQTLRARYFANCAWDALAIPTMLAIDAAITMTPPQGGDPVLAAVRRGHLRGEGVVHFAVPPRDFYADIRYT